jgi:hypothetical protein
MRRSPGMMVCSSQLSDRWPMTCAGEVGVCGEGAVSLEAWRRAPCTRSMACCAAPAPTMHVEVHAAQSITNAID